MRVFVFTMVISAHVVTATLDGDKVWVSGWGMLMHYTRNAFVFISAFVLCYSYRHRDIRPLSFWRRRIGLVLWPYLIYSFVYSVLGSVRGEFPGIGRWLLDFGASVLLGNTWYHLYFLLITIQVYLLFPLLHLLMRKTMRYHGWLLLAATVVQLGFMAMITWAPRAPMPFALMWDKPDIMIPIYPVFLIGGAACAFHLDALNRWVRERFGLVAIIGAAGLAISLGIYLARAIGGSAKIAALPFYPGLLPWAAGATLVVFALGAIWQHRTTEDSRSSKLIAAGAHRAFGVFAIHPMVIFVLQVFVIDWLVPLLPYDLPRAALLFLITVAGSLVIVEVLLRTPLSKLLLARPRMPIRPPASPTG